MQGPAEISFPPNGASGVPGSASPILSSLAILKVNYDHQGRDFIDNFVPFAVEVLRSAGRGGLKAPEATESLKALFGLAIPEGAVRSILRRAVKLGFVESRGYGVFALDRLGEEAPALSVERVAVARAQDQLISRLIAFSDEHLSKPWTRTQAENALVRFATSRGIQVLASRPALVDMAQGSEAPDEEHLLGEFVIRAQGSDPTIYRQLESLIKGALLASAMYYPDLGRLQSRFDHLDVYLDTRLILRALGTSGPQHEAAARELIDLMYELGASLSAFDSTLTEVRNVLGAASAALRQSRRLRENSGEALEYMASAGYRSSDVELIIAQLDRRLRALRISPKERPEYTSPLGIDEEAFEHDLRFANTSRRGYAEEALRHDVSAVTAVHRLRNGRPQPVLESAKAIFLTTNVLLARVSTEFFRSHYREEGVPLCYVDYQFATLAWLKKPTAAPKLPMLQVIADSYAAINPPDGLWRAYLAEIARLEDRGDISAEDYFTLRFTMAAKRALVDTVEPGDSVETSVPEILAKTQSALREEAREALMSERVLEAPKHGDQARDEASYPHPEFEADRVRRETAVNVFASTIGRFVARLVFVSGAFAVALILYLGASPILPALPQPTLEAFRPFFWISGFFVFILGGLGLIFGTSVHSVARRVEVHITRWVNDALARRFL